MAATPILQAYRALRPEDEIVMSVITPGGHEVASGLIGKALTRVFYAPFDTPWAVRRAVSAVKPAVFVNLETELWPNLLFNVRRHGARLVLVNGRISDRSFRSYRRLRGLFRWVLGQFDRLLAQTERDAERLVEMGASADRVTVFGNAKFDQAADRLAETEVAALRSEFGLKEDVPVFVVGSTRQEDEEQMVTEAYIAARRELPDLVLIHAPRHVERAEEVASTLRDRGLDPVCRTEMDVEQKKSRQIILDTFGELGKVYALADVAFVGNSLTPPGGGQNPLQPLAQGKPVLYGPYMQNFRDIAALAERDGVGFRVQTAEELAEQIVKRVRDTSGRAGIAERAIALIRSNRGAAARYAEAIAALVDSPR